ncbi:lytic polysaccharide monooxygenase [Hypoxylon sp. FL1150]|nr:lytic polysaccharide monooxygenase [Hypoxylon sp. FL1150]
MRSFSTAVLGLAASATMVLGHGHVRRVVVGDVTYPGWEKAGGGSQPNAVTWSFTTQDEGPILAANVGTDDIICHQGATNAQSFVPVAAGSQLQVVRYNEIGGFEHPGPEMHYLASCGEPGCKDVAKQDLRFFKIYERGLVKGGWADPGTWEVQKWATTEIHKNAQPEGNGFVDTYTVNIPANIKPGQYILRHEVMGLHRADKGEAEFYPQCINLQISGSGSQQPDGQSATRMYSSEDPGVHVDIWDSDVESYIIPGPPLSSVASKRDIENTPAPKTHARDIKHWLS